MATSRSEEESGGVGGGGEYLTTDMTLATYLIMKKYTYNLVRHGKSKSGYPIGAWVFPNGDQLKADISLYDQGLAKVDPKSFHRSLTTTRRELFSELGIGGARAASH